VRAHAFGPLGYARVISLIRPENEASRGVARTLGMAVVGETMHGGFPHDVWSVERMSV
jgi:RimJ/RimL family protein N-acetyltransferase